MIVISVQLHAAIGYLTSTKNNHWKYLVKENAT